MKTICTKSHLYILLLCTYPILPPTKFRLFIVAIIIIFSTYYAFLSRKEFPNHYITSLFHLLLFFTIYGLALIILNPTIISGKGNMVSNSSYLTTIYLSLSPIFPIYYFTRKGLLNGKNVFIWITIFICLATYSFFSLQKHLLEVAMEEGKTPDDVTNNIGYLFLSLLPLILLLKNKVVFQYSTLIYCASFLMLSMKRGAIITAAICMIIFFVANSKGSNIKSTLKNTFWICVAIFCIYYIFSTYLLTSDYFLYKIEETTKNAGGRNDIYRVVWEHFLSNSNVISILFGEGANSSIQLTGNYAHNDWLEIIINQGIIGVSIYLYYWISFWKTLRYHKQCQNYYPLLMLFIICIMKSFFSMSYSGLSYVDCFAIGFFMGYDNTVAQS